MNKKVLFYTLIPFLDYTDCSYFKIKVYSTITIYKAVLCNLVVMCLFLLLLKTLLIQLLLCNMKIKVISTTPGTNVKSKRKLHVHYIQYIGVISKHKYFRQNMLVFIQVFVKIFRLADIKLEKLN